MPRRLATARICKGDRQVARRAGNFEKVKNLPPTWQKNTPMAKGHYRVCQAGKINRLRASCRSPLRNNKWPSRGCLNTRPGRHARQAKNSCGELGYCQGVLGGPASRPMLHSFCSGELFRRCYRFKAALGAPPSRRQHDQSSHSFPAQTQGVEYG